MGESCLAPLPEDFTVHFTNGNSMSLQPPDANGQKQWESVHQCPKCGHTVNLGEIDLRAISMGMIVCPIGEWSGLSTSRLWSRKTPTNSPGTPGPLLEGRGLSACIARAVFMAAIQFGELRHKGPHQLACDLRLVIGARCQISLRCKRLLRERTDGDAVTSGLQRRRVTLTTAFVASVRLRDTSVPSASNQISDWP
jgi:hypothetical protein